MAKKIIIRVKRVEYQIDRYEFDPEGEASLFDVAGETDWEPLIEHCKSFDIDLDENLSQLPHWMQRPKKMKSAAVPDDDDIAIPDTDYH